MRKISNMINLGRGKQVIAVARTADLVVMQLDALKGPYQADQLTAELEAVGIRLNQAPPDIYFKQKKGGGLGRVRYLFSKGFKKSRNHDILDNFMKLNP